jgi:hypothetical protein
MQEGIFEKFALKAIEQKTTPQQAAGHCVIKSIAVFSRVFVCRIAPVIALSL